MRLRLLSDLHADIPGNDWSPPPADCDLVVVAGDVMEGVANSMRGLRRVFPRDRIAYVAGNHEFYVTQGTPANQDLTWEAQRAEAARVACDLDILWLDDTAVVVDGLRVVGSTLWSDFAQRPESMQITEAMRTAADGARGMNDYRLIRTGRGRGKDRLRPSDTLAAHRRSVAFLEATLAEPHDGPTLVVTHHCPLPDPPVRPLDYCYRSDLTRLMDGDGAPDLWLHGHVHKRSDLVVGRTRVIANPRGYPAFRSFGHHSGVIAREVADFDETLVIEIDVPAPSFRL